MPRRVVVGFTKHSASDGNFSENPYNFEHFNLQEISLLVAGHSIPYRQSLTLDYDNNQYMQGYMTIMKGMHKGIYENGNDISYTDYKNGYAFYVFNLAPDLCDNEYSSIPKTGELQLQLKFAKQLHNNISAIFYLEFDSIIQINALRKVFFDYRV